MAGDVVSSLVFQESYKPCLTTLEQLQENVAKRNQLILGMTKSSGDKRLDMAVLEETKAEIRLGWADGPWSLDSLEEGATVSRRFPLDQHDKIRMIDDYSISGVNDSCTVNAKLDLHVVDTFVATIKSYFAGMQASQKDTASLLAKTYDLKSAYRQIPIHPAHAKFGYF